MTDSWLDVTGDTSWEIAAHGERLDYDAESGREVVRFGGRTYRLEPSWHCGFPATRITILGEVAS